MNGNLERLNELQALISVAESENLGDVLTEAFSVRSQISDPMARKVAETMLSQLRGMSARAEIGWRLFSEEQRIPRPLEDLEILQLLGLERALHELCYACESVELSSVTSWGGSTSTRFYLNSIYHYVSSMFLVDTSSPRQRGLPMGGTVIRVLHAIGVSDLLNPIASVLSQPMTSRVTFGDTILRLRHSYLVHGDFSLRRIEYLIARSEMRDPAQVERFNSLIWDLYYQLLLLRLRMVALFTHNDIQVEPAATRYLSSVMDSSKSSGAP